MVDLVLSVGLMFESLAAHPELGRHYRASLSFDSQDDVYHYRAFERTE